MKRLLNIEFQKILNYRTAKIFIAIYFILLALMGFFVTIIKPTVGGVEIDLARLGAYIFPFVWQNVAYFADFGSIFLAIIIITNIANEYTYRTLRQNIIDGLTKKEFLISKLLVAFIFAALSSILVFVVSLGLGLYYTENPTNIFDGARFVFAYFLKLWLFFTFCTFLGFWIRKSGFAFMVLILWRLGELILLGIEHLGSYRNTYIFTYLPANSSTVLLPFAKVSLANFTSNESIFTLGKIDSTACICVCVYIVIFSYLSYWLLKKRDL